MVFGSLRSAGAVPVPPELLDTLAMVHGIREAQRRGRATAPLWPWSRMTGFRQVQGVTCRRRHPGRPPRLPQGPAARLRSPLIKCRRPMGDTGWSAA